jgi:ferredoxin
VRGRRAQAPVERIRVDPVACEGIGICAHLAPQLITVDSWGFPILPVEPVQPRARRQAAAAVAACPRRALFLEPDRRRAGG